MHLQHIFWGVPEPAQIFVQSQDDYTFCDLATQANPMGPNGGAWCNGTLQGWGWWHRNWESCRFFFMVRPLKYGEHHESELKMVKRCEMVFLKICC